MRRFLVLLILAFAIPTRAELILSCKRCNPGNSKDPSGRVLCFDCSTEDPPLEPVVTCGQCSTDRVGASACDHCTVTWPAE